MNKHCHLYRINGVEDHLHIVLYIHPSLAFGTLVKDKIRATSAHIKKSNLLPKFRGWQNEYSAFTYFNERGNLIC